VDENNSVILSALPLLISKAELTPQMPDNIKAGDFMQLRVNISALNNESISQSNNNSRIFAAIMISRKDYENASLKLDTNGTMESRKSTLILGDKSMQIQLSNISSEQLMPLLYLLPENSAIGIQESKESWADILLITDENWDKGSYILTYAVYSPGKGLLGLNQETVEVV
jgi:methanogen extracellular protein (TIGR04279 family)